MDCVHHIVSAAWEKNSNLSDDSDKTGAQTVLAQAVLAAAYPVAEVARPGLSTCTKTTRNRREKRS
jgi:hypothetical protein